MTILQSINIYRSIRLNWRGAAANQKWYELQQAQAKYAEAFTSPKIIFPRFVNQPCFALDTTGFFINNAISAIPTGDRNLLFYLMSPVSWFILRALGALYGEWLSPDSWTCNRTPANSIVFRRRKNGNC